MRNKNRLQVRTVNFSEKKREHALFFVIIVAIQKRFYVGSSAQTEVTPRQPSRPMQPFAGLEGVTVMSVS